MGGVKKSSYIFLCSLLGVLLFLVLQRVVVLGYLALVAQGVIVWTSNLSYMQFAAVDYVTLFLAMFCGAWYGIWLGEYWYEQVYELGIWPGITHHIRYHFSPVKGRNAKLKQKVEAIKDQLEDDLNQVEHLVQQIPQEIAHPVPIKRRIVRKKPVSLGLASESKRPVRRSRTAKAG